MSATEELDRDAKLSDLVGELISFVKDLSYEVGGETYECMYYTLADIKRRARELGVR